MPTGYQIIERSKIHYLTFQVVYWIDVFSRKAYRDLFLESPAYCRQHKEPEVYGYVIMTNHIHLLVRSEAGDLSGTIRDLKKFTGKAIVEAPWVATARAGANGYCGCWHMRRGAGTGDSVMKWYHYIIQKMEQVNY